MTRIGVLTHRLHSIIFWLLLLFFCGLLSFHHHHRHVALAQEAKIVLSEESIAYLKQHAEQEGVVVTESGLQYRILRKGDGFHHPGPLTKARCHYEGKFIDGEVFDSSYERDEPTVFEPRNVIKGWREAMYQMVAGDKWELVIPPDIGYGSQGSLPKIPPNAVLHFVMEIIDMKGNDKKVNFTCEPAAPTPETCEQRELDYMEKWRQKDLDIIKTEVNRLSQMRKRDMEHKLMKWVYNRFHLLRKLYDVLKRENAEL